MLFQWESHGKQVLRDISQVAPELEKQAQGLKLRFWRGCQVLRHLNSCTYEDLNGIANVGPVSANKILIQRRAGGDFEAWQGRPGPVAGGFLSLDHCHDILGRSANKILQSVEQAVRAEAQALR